MQFKCSWNTCFQKWIWQICRSCLSVASPLHDWFQLVTVVVNVWKRLYNLIPVDKYEILSCSSRFLTAVLQRCWLQASRVGSWGAEQSWWEHWGLGRLPHCSLMLLVANIKRSKAADWMGALRAWQASDVSTWLSTGGLSAIVKNWSEKWKSMWKRKKWKEEEKWHVRTDQKIFFW